ncbi:MAG: Bifunctional ligase/repressor BirA [Candidatus Methanoperedenaceae archaeon GB37]|nr:MAG: Bifunctional ligase/repressor BirA [Candidatus Methanoperedenaceae archaeon GB37]CAD7778671.1 Bifunctional ligase/repressor BirA [Candidatus Methanoperedenaceae archaeon GB37]
MEGLIRDREREIILKNMVQKLKKEEFEKRYAKEKEAERILRRGEMIGANLWCYHSVTRTMEVAKKYIENCYTLRQTPYSGTVFIAQTVNQAQGRYNRKWYALPGGLWFSFILYPEVESPYIHLYPLSLGIACCEALREIGINVCIKWVNDLVFNRHKVGGILGETYISSRKETYLIFGVGINVNNSFPSTLDIPAISLKKITGKALNIDLLFPLILIKLIWYVGLVHEAELKKETQEIIEMWLKYTNILGQKMYYAEDLKIDKKREVEILGLDPFGGLIVRFCDTERVETLYSGELTYI